MLSGIKSATKRAWTRFQGDEIRQLRRQVSILQSACDRLTDEIERSRRDQRLIFRQIAPRTEPSIGCVGGDGFRYNEIFILGSGSSVLELSEEEKEYIRGSQSIAMNRFILFWETAGIWPSFVFLADSLGVAWRVFAKTVEMILQESDCDRPTLLLESEFELAVPLSLDALFFRRDDRLGNNHKLAESIDQQLFFHRGSLTSLLNLVWVLRLAPHVRLVGIDLNRPGTFFEEKKYDRRYADVFNPWDDVASSQGVHATVANMAGLGWGNDSMLDQFDLLLTELKSRGVTVTSANESSLLVQEGFCKFDPVLPD